MAKDRNGKALEVGDKVLIPCTVRQVFGDGDAAGVLVEPAEKTQGGAHTIPLSSKQVIADAGGQAPKAG